MITGKNYDAEFHVVVQIQQLDSNSVKFPVCYQ